MSQSGIDIILFQQFIPALGSFVINDFIAFACNGGLGSTWTIEYVLCIHHLDIQLLGKIPVAISSIAQKTEFNAFHIIIFMCKISSAGIAQKNLKLAKVTQFSKSPQLTVVEKCGYYPEMYVHIFGERRFSEQLPIWVRYGFRKIVVTHPE